MKRKLKKVLYITVIYSMVVVITLVLANRVEKLESNFDLRNNNTSIALLDN